MASKKDTADDGLSRKRAELIIKVRSGQMTATEAAAALGVSRKTYYEWEERALQGMLSALENGTPGRPRKEVDQEKEALKNQVKRLEKDLAVHQTALKVRELLGPLFPQAAEEEREEVLPVRRKTASKKKQATKALTHMDKLKRQFLLPWRFVCRICGLAYSTVMRWIGRRRRGASVIMAPGPKKTATVDLGVLGEQIRGLSHRAKRTGGTGPLYAKVKDKVSRREFQARVTQARRDADRQRRAELKRVEWNQAAVAWAIDDTRLGKDDRSGRKLYLNTVFDPSPRYTFTSLIGYLASGRRIAAHLRRLFERHGPPLILKRDNAGNLNDEAVNRLLWEYLVIPLNSPTHFPLYNGGIERAQRDIKRVLYQRLGDLPTSMGRVVDHTEEAIYVLNHKQRKVLSGATPCERLHDPGKIIFTPQDRRAILGDMADIAQAIHRRLDDKTERGRATAQRLAIETWLKKEGLITVTQGGGVSPNFSRDESHK